MSLRRAIAPLGRRLLARRLPPARAGGARLARAVSERHSRPAPVDAATRLVRPRIESSPPPARSLAREAQPAELPKVPRLPGVSEDAAKWLFDVQGPVEWIEQAPGGAPAPPPQPQPPPAPEQPKRMRSEIPRPRLQEVGRRRISRAPADAATTTTTSPAQPRPTSPPPAPKPEATGQRTAPAVSK